MVYIKKLICIIIVAVEAVLSNKGQNVGASLKNLDKRAEYTFTGPYWKNPTGRDILNVISINISHY